MTDDFKPLRSSLQNHAHLKLVSGAAEIMQDRPSAGDKTFAPRLLAITPHLGRDGEPAFRLIRRV